MEPYTARRLKERSKTRLKDVVSICGVLHVTHIITLSQCESGTSMRMIRVPRGPTITFDVCSSSDGHHLVFRNLNYS
jgi:ribosome biogenesis protein SSF1/2